jgi:heparin binding hemagglutinin HbhA
MFAFSVNTLTFLPNLHSSIENTFDQLAQHRRIIMGVLTTYQQQLQDMVNKGIDAAEKQQKRLSAKPFDMAEKLEESARTHSVKSLRKSYYGYSESVFDQLRELNGTVGEFTAQLISRVDKQVANGADTVKEGAVDVAVTAEDVKAAVEPTKSARKSSPKKAKAAPVAAAKVEKAEDSKDVKAEEVEPAKPSDAKTENTASA